MASKKRPVKLTQTDASVGVTDVGNAVNLGNEDGKSRKRAHSEKADWTVERDAQIAKLHALFMFAENTPAFIDWKETRLVKLILLQDKPELGVKELKALVRDTAIKLADQRESRASIRQYQDEASGLKDRIAHLVEMEGMDAKQVNYVLELGKYSIVHGSAVENMSAMLSSIRWIYEKLLCEYQNVLTKKYGAANIPAG